MAAVVVTIIAAPAELHRSAAASAARANCFFMEFLVALGRNRRAWVARTDCPQFRLSGHRSVADSCLAAIGAEVVRRGGTVRVALPRETAYQD